MRKFALIAALGATSLSLAACGAAQTSKGESTDAAGMGSATESDAVATGAGANGATDAGAANVTTDANTQ
jgi:hypothetical protein